MTSANHSAVRSEIAEILRSDMYVTKDPIVDDDELITDLGLDSANIAIGLVAIEHRMNVALTHQEIIECATFGALVHIVANHVDANTPQV